MAINVKNMKTWVKALRSGKYKQGKGQLRFDNTFCCLGVACDISKLDKWNKKWFYSEEHLALPHSVRDWLGLRSKDPTVGSKCLSAYNDDGKTFQEIADIIEREYDLKNR